MLHTMVVLYTMVCPLDPDLPQLSINHKHHQDHAHPTELLAQEHVRGTGRARLVSLTWLLTSTVSTPDPPPSPAATE